MVNIKWYGWCWAMKKGYNKELKHTPNGVGAFNEAWDMLKMGFPPSSGPSPLPSFDKPPNGGALNGNGTEEYSHKDLDGESLIDFLIQTLDMDYQDAKVLVNHHKTKEMASASQRKAKAAAEDALEGEAPPMPPPQPPMGGPPMGGPPMGKPPMGMGKPPMGLGGPI